MIDVSLDKKDAIRVDWYKSEKSNRLRLYVFLCACGKEMKSRPSYLIKHSGKCGTCNAKETIKHTHKINRLRPYEAKFNVFKYKCPETDVTYEDYLKFVGSNCHYCERLLPWKPYEKNTSGFWLDRKNNNLGHLKNNLVVCCGVCNKTKRDEFSYEEFRLLGPVLKQIRLNREHHE